MKKGPIDLYDTSIAFQHLDDAALEKTHFLFSLMKNKPLTQFGSFFLENALKLGLPVQGLIKSTIFKHFCGGTSLEECQKIFEKLKTYHIGCIFDFAVERKKEAAEFKRVYEEVLKTIEFNRKNKIKQGYVVFKMTGLLPEEILEKMSSHKPLNLDEEAKVQEARSRIKDMCQKIESIDGYLLVDAEETWIQPAIDQIVQDIADEFNTKRALIFHTLQMYRTDRFDFLQQLVANASQQKSHVGIKLVRGAYLHKERDQAQHENRPSPLFASKAETDHSFNQALLFCLDHLSTVHLFIGSHNEESTQIAVQYMQEKQGKNIPLTHERVTFSHLYGMGDHLSYNLAKHGLHVAKYIPYGPVKDAMPYLWRRAEENSSIDGQVGRELFLIKKERVRRKSGRKRI